MNTKDDIPFFEDPESARKPGVKTIEREMINAIVYNPAKDEVICLDWQKFGWRTFILGGIEKDENALAAALREITEETGYENLRFVSYLGLVRSGYFAAHKNENRISNATALLFSLENEERKEVKDSENLPHIFAWLPRPKVQDFLTLSSQKYIWERAQKYLKS